MSIKQVTHDPSVNSIEVVWVKIVPCEYPIQFLDLQDPSIIIGECHPGIVEQVIRQQVYTENQMDMLRNDLGAYAPAYEALIQSVEDAVRPLCPSTIERLKQSCIAKTQERLDNFARTRNYDGILSLCTYAQCDDPQFALEGQCGIRLRGQTWTTLYEIMDELQSGTRQMPISFTDIESELPVLEWPVL